MSVELELTADEVSMVLNHRHLMDELKRLDERTLDAFETFYEFEKWLQDNKEEASYKTFCDDFGYEGENRDGIYELFPDFKRRVHQFIMDKMRR